MAMQSAWPSMEERAVSEESESTCSDISWLKLGALKFYKICSTSQVNQLQ